MNQALMFRTALLVTVAAMADAVVMGQQISNVAAAFMSSHEPMMGALAWAAHMVLLLASSWALLCLVGSVPRVGHSLQRACFLAVFAVQHGFHQATGRTLGTHDLWTLFTHPVRQTLDTLGALVSWEVLEPAVLTGVGVLVLAEVAFGILIHETRKLLVHRLVFWGALASLCVHAWNPRDDVLADSFSHALLSLAQLRFEFREHGTAYHALPREELPPLEHPRVPDNNVVLIIDESIRADYLSINTPSLGTTPWLEQFLLAHPDQVFNYGVALAAGTYTFLSRTILLTGVDALPDTELHSLRQPTLFQWARQQGYRTVLWDAQGGEFPNHVIRTRDLSVIDDVILADPESAAGAPGADITLARGLRTRLENETGLFVVALKFGAHVPYEDRYPQSDVQHRVFTPSLNRGEVASLRNRPALVNSYKNAVRYAVDEFFKALWSGGLPQRSTFIWTSDHGQALLEDGRVEPHEGEQLEQALVPLVISSTDTWALQHLLRPSGVTISHLHLYPTLLSLLMHRESPLAAAHRSLMDPHFSVPLPGYLWGSLWHGAVKHPVMEGTRVKLRTGVYLY